MDCGPYSSSRLLTRRDRKPLSASALAPLISMQSKPAALPRSAEVPTRSTNASRSATGVSLMTESGTLGARPPKHT